MGRKKLSDEQRAKTKEELFEVSRKMIDEEGIDNLNIRDLCKKVGISYSSFYEYYENKDYLIAARVDLIDDFFKENEKEYLSSSDFNENLRNYIILYSKFAQSKNIEIVREIYRMQVYNIIDYDRYYNRPMIKILEGIIKDGIRSGQVSEDVPINNIIRMIISICRSTVIDWCFSNNEYNIVEFSENIVNYIDFKF